MADASGGQWPTRAELELPGRVPEFRFVGLGDPADAARICDALTPLIAELVGVEPASEASPASERPAVGYGLLLWHLRLVIFTSDLREAVFHWQHELGHPEGLTDSDEGVAMGKSFVWGDGTPGSTFAVVLFHLDIGRGLLDSWPGARALVAHELAHVHLGLHLLGRVSPTPHARTSCLDWPDLRRQMAVICFDESFAEHVGAAYIDDEGTAAACDLLARFATSTTARVRERVARYRHDGDLVMLWQFTVTEVAKFTNQLGRVVGLHLGRDLPDSLLLGLERATADLALPVLNMQAACERLIALTPAEVRNEAFAAAESAIEAIFVRYRVVPTWDAAGLRVDVPWRPGERERAERELSELRREPTGGWGSVVEFVRAFARPAGPPRD